MIELLKLVTISVGLCIILPASSTLILFAVAALVDTVTHLLGAI